jgi:phage repressor protein C with HTH and peptisase S24 domain
MKKIEQFDKYMKFKGLNDNKVTQQLGLSVGTLGKSRKENRDLSDRNVELILNFYADLNRTWLLTGEGEMLKPQVSQTITTNNGLAVANNGGSINYHHANHDANEAGEVEEIPVIPRYIYEETDVDAFEYINENDVPTSPKVKQFPNFDAYVNVYSDEMSPEINKGDKIAITPYEIGMERKVIDGRAYIIDTKYNGMMLRKLYKEDNGFRAESPNPAYRAEFIEYDEVVRVFRIVGLIRTNI